MKTKQKDGRRTAGAALRPAYMCIDDWVAFSGTGRTVAYEHITSGKIGSILVGRRRLIDVESGLAFLASLAVAPCPEGTTSQPGAGQPGDDGGPPMKRPRGRPRKFPPAGEPPVKLPRGRPRKPRPSIFGEPWERAS